MTLAAYYKLDSDVNDYSGNALDGTNTGVTFATGKVNNAGSFDGAADKIDAFGISEVDDWSISLWVYLDTDINTYYYPIGLSTTKGIFFGGTTQSQKWGIYDGTSFLLGSVISTLTWTHITITKSGTTYTLYLNGVQDNSGTLLDIDIDDLNIGVRSDDTLWHDGLIDDVRVYDHTLSLSEIIDIYNFDGEHELLIDDTDLSLELYSGLFSDVDVTYRINYAELILFDDSYSRVITKLREIAIKQLRIYVNGTLKYNGIVENWTPNEDGDIELYSIDYSLKLNGDPITIYDCAGNTASTIIADLISTYGGGLFTTSISSTTATYDDIFRYMTPLEIMQELALREFHSLRLTPARQWVFAARDTNDLGITYSEGTDFFDPSIKKASNRIKNSYYIIDSIGQPYKKKDLQSASNNFTRTAFLDIPDATTESQVRNYLDARLIKNSNVLTPTIIDVPQDFTLVSTGLIRMNYAKLAWVDRLTYVMGVIHSLNTPNSSIELVNYDPEADEAISDLFFDRRQLQKRNIDNTKDLIILADALVDVGMSSSIVIEKQTITNFQWNEAGQDDNATWNSTPTAWSEILSSSTMKILNTNLTRLRDLIQGEAVTLFDAANTTIELGSGTTAVTVTDSSLDTAIANTNQPMDPGFPQDGNDGEMIHQISIDDSDAVSFTANEAGLYVDGTLMARIVFSSSISKSEDENIRVKITTAFSDLNPTILMTRFLNKIRDLCQGKSVQALDNANTYIEYGSGNTAVTATDSDLANDNIPLTRKSQSVGFPKDDTDTAVAKFSTNITDSDLSTFSAIEMGMFENTDLLLRLVLDDNLDKAAGENVKTEIKLRFMEA